MDQGGRAWTPQWQSCSYAWHVPPWLVALSHFVNLYFSKARLALQQTNVSPVCEERREQGDKVATTRCSSLHQRPVC